jgi:hypothetical protein
VYSSRNRFSSRFINKATTAEPIQGGEENLLQSRSKISKRKYGKPKLAKTMKRDRVEPGLHNDAPKRVTTYCATVVETPKVKGFHPEP